MRSFLSIPLLILFTNLIGQDAAYTSFADNRILFNPSLVGVSGAQSWKIRGKSQWFNDGGSGYKTLGLIFEETMPCSIIDLGAKFNLNEEGSGLFRTWEAGIVSAMFIPLPSSQKHDHNLRAGADFSWGINSIDYNKLIFSDQLDPKYGNILQGSFISPNTGNSSWFFNPGVGFSLRSLWNKKSKQAVMTNAGMAMYRFYSLSGGKINQSVSILGLDNDNPVRYTGFFEMEFVPKYYGRQFLSMRPSIVYQKQGKIDYAEFGFRAGYTRSAGIGFYYHTSFLNEYGVNRWLSIHGDITIKLKKKRLMVVNFDYSSNISGLRNFSGPQFELGFTYHLAKSSICNAMDQQDDVPYNGSYNCPIMDVSPGKRKMYENIWYKE